MKCNCQSSVQETETSLSILGRKDLIHGIIVCKIVERAGGTTSGQEPPLNYQFQSHTTLTVGVETGSQCSIPATTSDTNYTDLPLL